MKCQMATLSSAGVFRQQRDFRKMYTTFLAHHLICVQHFLSLYASDVANYRFGKLMLSSRNGTICQKGDLLKLEVEASSNGFCSTPLLLVLWTNTQMSWFPPQLKCFNFLLLWISGKQTMQKDVPFSKQHLRIQVQMSRSQRRLSEESSQIPVKLNASSSVFALRMWCQERRYK